MSARVLVAYASKRGSTAETASWIAEALRAAGHQVDVADAAQIRDLALYEGVVLGSAVYLARWRSEAVHFLHRFGRQLGERRVWLFQAGPLDADPASLEVELPGSVRRAAERIGVRDVATFGGVLDPDPEGMIASKMAESGHAGDFRDRARITAWAKGIALDLEPSGLEFST